MFVDIFIFMNQKNNIDNMNESSLFFWLMFINNIAANSNSTKINTFKNKFKIDLLLY